MSHAGDNAGDKGEYRTMSVAGLSYRTEAQLIQKVMRLRDLEPSKRKRLIEEFYGVAMQEDRPIRDRAACARVLATLERNEIMSERNAIQEQGQELGAATDRLRAALGSPEARKALADLACSRVATSPEALATSPETTQPANAAELAARRVEPR